MKTSTQTLERLIRRLSARKAFLEREAELLKLQFDLVAGELRRTLKAKRQ